MSTVLRRVFKFLNKFFMVPMFRLGFGPFMGNPFTGYIMVLKTIGRKSGKVRYVPVNYTIYKGNVYCISGFRKEADWYRNLRAKPEIEMILPGGSIYARMQEISGTNEKRIVTRRILINAGFAGFFEGYNPHRISDEDLQIKTADMPVLRFQPLGIGNGAFDYGGWAWILAIVITILIVLALVS